MQEDEIPHLHDILSADVGQTRKWISTWSFDLFSHESSFQVRLRCGLTNEMTDVDEPSRCE